MSHEPLQITSVYWKSAGTVDPYITIKWDGKRVGLYHHNELYHEGREVYSDLESATAVAVDLLQRWVDGTLDKTHDVFGRRLQEPMPHARSQWSVGGRTRPRARFNLTDGGEH